MKNNWINKITLLLFIFTLAACKQNSELKNSTEKQSGVDSRSKIAWMGQWFGEGKKEALVRELASDFSFANQGYEVKLEFPHQMLKMDLNADVYNAYARAVAGWVTTNTWPYDLMQCDSYLYNTVANIIGDPYWGDKYLVDFRNEPWFIEAHKSGIFTSGKRNQAFGGLLPGAYIEGVWNVIYVSASVERKLGITVKRQDMTLGDFISYAKVVYEYNKSHSDKITFLYLPRATPLLDHLAMTALGKDSASNRQEGFEVLEKVYRALEKAVPYQPLAKYYTMVNDKDLFANKTLFTYNPSWVALIWQARYPEDEKNMHPCELPSIDNGKATCYSGMYNAAFVVPKNAKNKEGAIKLMKFISSSETAEKWLKISKCPTGLRSKAVYSDLANSEISKFSQHIKTKFNDNLKEVNLAEVLFKSKKNIDFYQLQLLRGEISVEGALKKVREQLAGK